jgi:hypothetical protein
VRLNLVRAGSPKNSSVIDKGKLSVEAVDEGCILCVYGDRADLFTKVCMHEDEIFACLGYDNPRLSSISGRLPTADENVSFVAVDSDFPACRFSVYHDVDILVQSPLTIWVVYSGVAARESIHTVASNSDLLRGATDGSIERDWLGWFCDIVSLELVLRWWCCGTRCLSLNVHRADKENE